MDRGSLLGQAANVLVNIVGGNDLTLAEVQTVMEELSQHIGEDTQLLFGAAVDPAGRKAGRDVDQFAWRPGQRSDDDGVCARRDRGSSCGVATAGDFASTPVPVAVLICLGPGERWQCLPRGPWRWRQASSENAVRGRFDKSEPTIIDGEDLDVPTFMRKNLKVK